MHTIRVGSLRDLIEVYDRDVAMLEHKIRERVQDHAGYRAIQAIDGFGPIMTAIPVAALHGHRKRCQTTH